MDNIMNIEELYQEIEAMDKGRWNSVCMALIDIDFFTNVYQRVGDQEGNLILNRILEYIRELECDKIGYESDEFLLIFFNKTIDEVYPEMENFRKKFRRMKFISPESAYAKLPITISIGLTVYNGIAGTKNLPFKKAEIALLMAKKNGRNRIEIYIDDIRIIKSGKYDVTTLIGSKRMGRCCYPSTIQEVRLTEPYGVDMDNQGHLIYVDRGNHRICKIISDNKIICIAGNGISGYAGDGKAAVMASLSKPSGVAVGADGSVYIADTGNHCLRRIGIDGKIYPFAGNGTNGYSGDGGPAVIATLSRPGGVTVDHYGNVYTNDYGNNVIRKISPEGIISTVVGTGEFGYDGDGNPAIQCTLNKPYGVIVSRCGTYLYIADYGNHCIRRVNNTTGIIDTICGTGVAGFTQNTKNGKDTMLKTPYWVGTYGNDHIVIADSGNHCIKIMNLKTNIVQTLIGDGQAGYIDGNKNDLVRFNIPAGFICDIERRTIYIADYANNAIRKYRV